MRDSTRPAAGSERPPVGGKALSANVLFGAIVFFGVGLFLLAAIFNPRVLSLLSPNHKLVESTIGRIHRAQFWFIAVGAFLVWLAVVLRRYRVLFTLAARSRLTNFSLMIFSLVIGVFVLNNLLSVRYYAERKVTVFTADEALGWKYKPGARGEYMGVEYVINDKGLRSPPVDYAKPAGESRILQLGDSVMAGHGLPYEGSASHLLQELFKRRGGRGVEIINAACDGYSPWQEYEYLISEGIKYAPDLVTVTFVPNDVTGKFRLKKFGGNEVAGQLAATEEYAARKSWIRRRLEGMPLYRFFRDVFIKVRFGADTTAGARRLEELQVRDLLDHPESDVVQEAWRVTLANLEEIVTFCADHSLKLLIIHVPFLTQFEIAEGPRAPQEILAEFCRLHSVPYLDCYRAYVEDMKKFERPAKYYFRRLAEDRIDAMHPSIEANGLIAHVTFEFIEKNKLLN
jgi:lysophospholipase L1-like esterase